MEVNPNHVESLKLLAGMYIWWKAPDEALKNPQRLLTQVMNIGDYDDVQVMANLIGDEPLKEALTSAQAGQFNARSWHYWHYRLGLANSGRVPPLPVRQFSAPSVQAPS